MGFNFPHIHRGIETVIGERNETEKRAQNYAAQQKVRDYQNKNGKKGSRIIILVGINKYILRFLIIRKKDTLDVCLLGKKEIYGFFG
jgi:hypothetical protein